MADLKRLLLKKAGSGGRGSEPTPIFSIAPGKHRSFKLFLAGLVSLSITGACIENGLNPLALLAIPVIVTALLRSDYSRPFLGTERLLTVLFFLYLVVFSVVLALMQGLFNAPLFLVYFTFGTLLVRAFSPLTDRHMYQLIFLTVGMVLISCTLTNHFLFAALLPFYLFALMGTLLTFLMAKHEDAEGRVGPRGPGPVPAVVRPGKLGVYLLFVLALTALLFVIFPRPFISFPGVQAAGPAGGGRGFAGLAQSISYRDMVRMSGRERIAFTASFHQRPSGDAPYWRGRVLAEFDGERWSAGSRQRGFTRPVRSAAEERFHYVIFPHRLRSDHVYVYGYPLWVLGHQRKPLFVNMQGEVSIDSPFLFSNSYVVEAASIPPPVTLPLDPVYLSTGGSTPEIDKLARQWTKGADTPEQKARALIERFRRGFRYTLQTPPPPEGVHPLEHFLLRTRAGHCEYFAGAMVLMLRAVEVPARVVEGFQGMEPTDEPDKFIVRFTHAHAWVEALLDGSTWARLDPTPPGRSLEEFSILVRWITDFFDRADYLWTNSIVHFDRSDQQSIFRTLARLMSGQIGWSFTLPEGLKLYLLAGLIFAAAALALLALIFMRKRRKDEISSSYRKAMNSLVRKGILQGVHPWHEDNLAEASRNAPALKPALSEFMETYLQVRFGQATDLTVERLRQAGKDLINQLPQRTSYK
ncbi:MAG: transglutaminaseTgpA domain-containing protein [Thermodesulfobacteriota bacterium]